MHSRNFCSSYRCSFILFYSQSILLWVSVAVSITGCSPDKKDWYKSFNSDRAFAHVQKQVVLGERPSGSVELAKAADQIEAELKGCGLKVHCSEFEVSGTVRGAVRFRNVIATTASWPPREGAVLLASHYDTKWLPGERFVGANDAGSSTGCLLEIARVLSTVRSSHRDFVFVFFDGEEAFGEYTEKDGLYGSRRLASEMKVNGSLRRLRAMILLDMIGDEDLKVTIPTGNPALVKAVFDASEALGWRDHFSLGDVPMLDDHHPFEAEGVPCADLIDFNYGPQNSYWHTRQDTLDKISPQSLEIVGKTVLKMLEDMSSEAR